VSAGSTPRSAETDPQPIRQRYLLVLNIPVFKDPSGARWTDRLWHKDLVQHVEYIDRFVLACPFIDVPAAPPGMVRIEDPRVNFVELPGRRKLTLNLPVTIARLWSAIGDAQVVHTGLGGWLPISVCNLTALMSRLRRRYLLVMVESSPWRLVPGEPATLARRARAVLSEWVNRRNLDSVSLAIFTHASYRDSLMPQRLERSHVIQASWIDADAIISDEQAAAQRDRKRARGGAVRLLFAGRVTAAKGVPVLLEAMRSLDAQGLGVELHVIGEGDLLGACASLKRVLRVARLEVLAPVAYGPDFFQLLRSYDAVIVPSVTDEQPRIVYDAYSQAIPVLASETVGHRECVEDGVTGRMCRANDVAALTELVHWASEHRERLADMGPACVERARALTHREMHRRRWRLLSDELKAQPDRP
jgi:glycosyltransferase involved in cell wall biosynthesis